jgi:LemA protein
MAAVVIAVVVVGVAVWAASTYNRFVQRRNRAANAWAQVEVQLKRRWDLVPNLVEVVKGYAAHERETFEAVTQARAAAQGGGATEPATTSQTEQTLGLALNRLLAVVEAYPELRADGRFAELQDQLTVTEDKIAVARQIYNDTVLTYDNGIQAVPGVLIAKAFGFQARDYFEAEVGHREVPDVGA